MQLSLFDNALPTLDKDQITLELFQAYYDARKNKRNTINQLVFEKHLEHNIFQLADEIIEYRYKPKPSICFIIDKPIKREIFAADFSDRVVHHFIYNHIYPIFDPTFIHDSYSCRKGKGTHYGIKRVEEFVRCCSNDYTTDCYILKLDIKGYFMAMNKSLLYAKVKTTLLAYQAKLKCDMDLMLYLIQQTIFNDPRKDCKIKGKRADWDDLPASKSLFRAQPDCGLPIGNLTSQLFGNVYMDELDQYAKHTLNLKYYGRYVDDFIIIHPDQNYLRTLIPKLSHFLISKLNLTPDPQAKTNDEHKQQG